MRLLEIRSTDEWDRSDFAMSEEELELEEAVRAIQRLLDRPQLPRLTREALQSAVHVLKGAKA